MTEQELIRALRELIAKASSDAPDPRILAREISWRDQQRIRLLAGLSIFFWLLAAAGLILLCVGLDRFVIWVRIQDFYPVVRSSGTDKPGPDAPRVRGHGYPRLSPFEAVRWRESVPEVRVEGVWYELLSLNGISSQEIVTFLKTVEKEEDWQQKRFEEDLVEVLRVMGHDVGKSATLKVRQLDSGQEKVLKDVPMTEKNRDALRDARQQRSLRNVRPRDGAAASPSAFDPRVRNPEREGEMLRGTQLLHKSIWIVAGSAVSLFLGALCTVLLVTTSRRTTLGQINLSLMELSEQLKQLRLANPSEKVHKPENP